MGKKVNATITVLDYLRLLISWGKRLRSTDIN